MSIGQKGAQTLYHAFDLAQWLGFPLNTHVTINFANTRCCPSRAVKAFARLRRDYHGKWCSRHPNLRHAATGVHAFENSREEEVFLTIGEGDDHNVHVHWAVHVPPQLAMEFEHELTRWVEIVTGGPCDEFTIKITHRPQNIVRAYLLKGIQTMWAETYKAIAQPQGLIVGGRRTGTTSNLSRTNRIEADRTRGIRRRIPARPRPMPAVHAAL